MSEVQEQTTGAVDGGNFFASENPDSDAVKALAAAAVEGSTETATEEGAVESKPSEVEVEPKKDPEADKFAAKFAALARKEKQMRDKERSMLQKEKEFESKIEQLKADFEKQKQELSSKLLDPSLFKKNSKEALEKAGITFEQLAESMLNDGKPTAEQMVLDIKAQAEAEIQKLRDELAQKELKDQESKHQQALNNFKNEIKSFVSSNNDYELIQANDAIDLVYEVIEDYHAKTIAESEDGQGVILSIKDAADAVEAHFLEEAKKHLSLNKIKGLLTPKEEPIATQTKTKASPTLSNTQSAVVPKTVQKSLSDDESKREAAKLIRWED